MNRPIIILSMSLLSALPCGAAPELAEHALSQIDSQHFLSTDKQALMTKLAALADFSATFEQQVFDFQGKLLQQNSGELAVSKPNKVRWQTMQPDESLMVSDGQALWFYDPFIEQVAIYAIDSATVNTPVLLLTSNDPALWQQYQVEQPAENRYLIKAINASSKVSSLELEFAAQQLASFVIVDSTGQLSKVNLSQYQPLSTANDALFSFTVPEGVEIDDQR